MWVWWNMEWLVCVSITPVSISPRDKRKCNMRERDELSKVLKFCFIYPQDLKEAYRKLKACLIIPKEINY